MRIPFLIACVALAVGAWSPKAEAVCNVRGEFCGYPAWAANAFSSPRDRVPDAWLIDPPLQWTFSYDRSPRDKRHYRHRRR